MKWATMYLSLGQLTITKCVGVCVWGGGGGGVGVGSLGGVGDYSFVKVIFYP